MEPQSDKRKKKNDSAFASLAKVRLLFEAGMELGGLRISESGSPIYRAAFKKTVRFFELLQKSVIFVGKKERKKRNEPMRKRYLVCLMAVAATFPALDGASRRIHCQKNK